MLYTYLYVSTVEIRNDKIASKMVIFITTVPTAAAGLGEI